MALDVHIVATEIANAINAEILAREDGDTLLQSNLDDETAARITADDDLSDRITNEENDRITEIDGLSTLLSNEVTAREDADIALEADATAKANAANADAKAYADGLVVSIFRPAGDWDASLGTWPTTGTGPGGGIRRGDSYNVIVSGDIGSKSFDVGDSFYANQATPGQVDANWSRWDTNTEQATELERGTVREATQAEVEDTTTIVQANYVSPRKLWMAFTKAWTVTSFLNAVRGTLLTGLVTTDNNDVLATDSIVIAFGKLKRRLNDLLSDAAGFGALISGHISNTSNPHAVTKSQVGLGSADNTADTAKPVSVAQAAAIALKLDAPVVSPYTGTHTLGLSDATDIVMMNVAGANNCEIPADGTANFPVGTEIKVIQYGAGQTTITAAGGVTIRAYGAWVKLAGQYAQCVLTKIGANEWTVDGNLVP